MYTPAFITSFTGLRPPASHKTPHGSPRCAMGDSIAPQIVIVNTGNEQTSRLTLRWDPIPPNTADAATVNANVALNLALRSVSNSKTTPAPVEPCPPSIAPKDFYFPLDKRNKAPVISMDHDQSISVSMDTINPSVGGQAANSTDSVAFWKAPVYKYSAPDADAPVNPEVLSTELYEAYFPSKIRNFAPMISMKPPAGDWDNTAYLQVGSEFISLNPDIARELSVTPEEQDSPPFVASATVEKYFGGEFMSKAPQITIDEETPRVEFSLGEIEPSSSSVSAVFAAAGRSNEE